MEKKKQLENTSVFIYAASAVHSALLVGLLKAKIIGFSLKEPMA